MPHTIELTQFLFESYVACFLYCRIKMLFCCFLERRLSKVISCSKSKHEWNEMKSSNLHTTALFKKRKQQKTLDNQMS